MLTIRTVEMREVFMIFVLIVLKLQLVDQGQMDGDFDSLLCVSEALSSFTLQWIVQATMLFLPKGHGGVFLVFRGAEEPSSQQTA
jgi:hypothetical protein